jgi:hypothetical protein
MRTKGAALGTGTNWIFNFLVVEITPYGIQSLHWQFYIIWTVFNASFVPLVYFLLPETAGRSLEDIDDYYRNNPPLLVFRDKEATRSGRPEKYSRKEEEEVRRNSSVDPAVLRRGSRVSGHHVAAAAGGGMVNRSSEEEYEGKTDVGEGEQVRYKEDA